MRMRMGVRLVLALLLSATAVLVGTPAQAAAVPDPCPRCSGAEDHPAPDTVVGPGETLSQLAADHHVPGGVAALYEMNKAVLPDADTVVAGQQLRVDDGRFPPANVYVFLFTEGKSVIAQLSVRDPQGLVFVVYRSEFSGNAFSVRSYRPSPDDSRRTVIENLSQVRIGVTIEKDKKIINQLPVLSGTSLWFSPSGAPVL